MAVNRYTNLQYNTLNDLPLLEVPFEQIDQMLGQSQATKSAFDKLSSAGFTHLNNPSDIALAKKVREYQSDVVNSAAEEAQKGNVAGYMQSLRSGMQRLTELRGPGGPIEALESRVKQKKIRDQKLKEFFKDAPLVAEYYINNRPLPDIQYDPANKTYNPISEEGRIFKHYTGSEINEFFNKNLDNIKDTLLKDGIVSKKALNSITDLWTFKKVMGRNFEDVFQTLASVVPEDIKMSLLQEENANRWLMGKDEIKAINPYTKVGDKLVINSDDPLGRLLIGYAREGTRENVDYDRIKVEDKVKLDAIKRARDEEKEKLITNTRRSMVMGVKNPMEAWPFDFGSRGVNTNKVNQQYRKDNPFTSQYLPDSGKSYTSPKDFISNVLEGKLENQAPGITPIAKKYEDHLNKLQKEGKYKEAYKFVQSKYEELASHFNQLTMNYHVYPDTKEGIQMYERMNKKYIDNGAIQTHSAFHIVDPANIEGSTEPMKWNEVVEYLGLEEGDKLEDYLVLDGSVTALQDRAPSGLFYVGKKKDGTPIQLIGSEQSVEHSRIKEPVYNLYSSAATPLDVPSRIGQVSGILIPDPESGETVDISEAYPRGFFTTHEFLRQSDVIQSQLDYYTELSMKNGTFNSKEIGELTKKLNELKDNPEQDKIIPEGASKFTVYSAEDYQDYLDGKNVIPVGDNQLLEIITQTLEQRAQQR